MDKYLYEWRILYKIHEHTKYFIIRAEELGYKSRIGPLNELKNAYEHVIRYQTAVMGIQENKSEDYICTNIERAIGHEYRAFFDTADWFSMILRKTILELLAPYSPTNIKKAIPNYHSDIRPRIDEITEEISRLRSGKDVGNADELLPSVEHYYNILNELLEMFRSVSKRIGCMLNFMKKKRIYEEWQRRINEVN